MVACSRLSDSEEEAKEKGTRKVSGAERGGAGRSGAGKRKKEKGKWKGERPPLLSPVSSRFIFVFALSQFSGPDYLGAWNRLALRYFISLLFIFADQVFIDPTFIRIFVCGPLQSFVVNVCTFLQRRRTRVGCMGVPSLPV